MVDPNEYFKTVVGKQIKLTDSNNPSILTEKFKLTKDEELIYDEIIVFTESHSYLKKYEEETKSNNTSQNNGFPYLMNHEFILGGSLSYDTDKKLSEMNNKELLIMVKNRVQSFLNNGDSNFK